MGSLMRWDPFGDLLAVPREIDRVLDWSIPQRMFRGASSPAVLMPTMDVLNRGDDMVVRVELPGIDPANVDITVSDDVLTISGERTSERETSDDDYVIKESSWGRFERRIALPRGLDPATINADFKDGVLEVSLPQARRLDEPKTHHVAIGRGTEH